MKLIQQLDIDIGRIETSFRNVETLKKAVRKGATIVRDAMRAKAPRKSGRLAASIGVAIQGGASTNLIAVRIGPNTKTYWRATFIEGGTKPHEIKPNPGKKSFTGKLRLNGGQFVESVQHPGAPAKPFIVPAFEATKEEAARVIAKEFDRMITEGFK